MRKDNTSDGRWQLFVGTLSMVNDKDIYHMYVFTHSCMIPSVSYQIIVD